MNKYNEKLKRMSNHLVNHPNDYQTVISILKAKSNSYAYEKKQKTNFMRKEIAKYKKEGLQ